MSRAIIVTDFAYKGIKRTGRGTGGRDSAPRSNIYSIVIPKTIISLNITVMSAGGIMA